MSAADARDGWKPRSRTLEALKPAPQARPTELDAIAVIGLKLMLVRRLAWCFVGSIVAWWGVAACGSFSGSDSAPSTDGGTADVVDGASTGDGGVSDGFADAGAFVRGHSAVMSTTSGALTLSAPPNAVKGDVLLLALSVLGAPTLTMPPFTKPTILGHCNNVNQLAIESSVAVYDGTTKSFSVTTTDTMAVLEGVIVAFANTGASADDIKVEDTEFEGGATLGVEVQHARDLVVVAMDVHQAGFNGGYLVSASGLSLVTNGVSLGVFAGAFAKGQTGPLGPFTNFAPPCWGTITYALPPAP